MLHEYQVEATPYQSFVRKRDLLMVPEVRDLRPALYPDAKFSQSELEQRFNFN